MSGNNNEFMSQVSNMDFEKRTRILEVAGFGDAAVPDAAAQFDEEPATNVKSRASGNGAHTLLLTICAIGISAMAIMQGFYFKDYLDAKDTIRTAQPLLEHYRLMDQLGVPRN